MFGREDCGRELLGPLLALAGLDKRCGGYCYCCFFLRRVEYEWLACCSRHMCFMQTKEQSLNCPAWSVALLLIMLL